MLKTQNHLRNGIWHVVLSCLLAGLAFPNTAKDSTWDVSLLSFVKMRGKSVGDSLWRSKTGFSGYVFIGKSSEHVDFMLFSYNWYTKHPLAASDDGSLCQFQLTVSTRRWKIQWNRCSSRQHRLNRKKTCNISSLILKESCYSLYCFESLSHFRTV